MDEAAYWKESCFMTLTFNDECLPLDGSLSKEVVQKYVKRVRKNTGKELKYYLCGEYGERNMRPHYHVIFFGLGHKDKKILDESWSFGFTYFRPLCFEVAQYVAAYVQKKLNGEMAKEVYGERIAPFSLMSKGLGKRWALDNIEYLNKYKCITIKGKPVGIPRYYTKVAPIDLGLLDDFWADGIAVTRANEAVLKKAAKWDALGNPEDRWKLEKAKREQDDETLREKVSRRKRK